MAVCVRTCVCEWRGKWPNLQRFPIIYYYVYLLCDGPTDLIRSPHRIVCFFLSPPKHIVFVRRMRAFVRLLLLGPTTSLNTIEKVSFPFLVFRWTCVASIARWIVVAVHGRTHTIVPAQHAAPKLYAFRGYHFVSRRCFPCTKRSREKESGRERGARDFFGRSIGFSLCIRAQMMYGSRLCDTHTYACTPNNNERSMGFHGHTHTTIVENNLAKNSTLHVVAARPFKSPIKINYTT